MSDSIYFHIDKPSSLPIGVSFDYIKNIESYKDESISTILLHDLLDYYSDDQIQSFVELLKSKLQNDGKIIIQSIDMKQLSRAVTFDEVDIDLVKQILYPIKKSIHTLHDIEKLFNSMGMKTVIKKYINLFEYYIVIKK